MAKDNDRDSKSKSNLDDDLFGEDDSTSSADKDPMYPQQESNKEDDLFGEDDSTSSADKDPMYPQQESNKDDDLFGEDDSTSSADKDPMYSHQESNKEDDLFGEDDSTSSADKDPMYPQQESNKDDDLFGEDDSTSSADKDPMYPQQESNKDDDLFGAESSNLDNNEHDELNEPASTASEYSTTDNLGKDEYGGGDDFNYDDGGVVTKKKRGGFILWIIALIVVIAGGYWAKETFFGAKQESSPPPAKLVKITPNKVMPIKKAVSPKKVIKPRLPEVTKQEHDALNDKLERQAMALKKRKEMLNRRHMVVNKKIDLNQKSIKGNELFIEELKRYNRSVNDSLSGLQDKTGKEFHGVSNKLDGINKTLKQLPILAGELELSKKNIHSSIEQLVMLQKQVVDLKKNMNILVKMNKQMKQVIDRQGQVVQANNKIDNRSLQDPAYVVQAVIQGRAWLTNQDGVLITVREGQEIPGYGTVTKIDLARGVVVMSNNMVFKETP